MTLTLEIVRIVMRYLAMYLITLGAPPVLAEHLGDPEIVGLIAGLIIAGFTEIGWVEAKVNAREAS